MVSIDREKFFDGYAANFNGISEKQKAAIAPILAAMEADEHVADLRHAAYMLATTKHETAHTFRPIEEYGKGKGRKYGIVNPETGKAYYGRGFVQLTWKDNYQSMAKVLGVNLVLQPELALDPAHAYRIMSYGMRNGSFTGKKLIDYINPSMCDYRNARKIINGLDCAERIAGYAEKFETILKETT